MYKTKRIVKDFEFYYLVELTRQKIKPLSRWEKPLPEKTNHWLRDNGLYVESIPRKTLSGKEVAETIFSTSGNYIDFYQKKFSHTLINKSAESQKLEGFLFGYPYCCVEQFILHPYSKNSLNRNVQSLLFHWACNDCRSTEDLLPYYRQIHNIVSEWYNCEFPGKRRIRNYQKSIYKAVAALLISSGYLAAQSPADSLHYIPLADDININGLSYAEEVYLGVYENSRISDDCQYFARHFKSIIDTLPDTIQTDRAYRIDYPMRGVVQCPKCGLNVNMGYVSVMNPLRNLKIDIPYIGLHFMDKGFFSFGSDDEYQRVDIDTLKKIIYPFDTQHRLKVEGDKDNDGLTDAEEDSLWIGYTAEHPDFNNDGVPDGVGIAEELIRLFPKLKEQPDSLHSSIEFNPVWGYQSLDSGADSLHLHNPCSH